MDVSPQSIAILPERHIAIASELDRLAEHIHATRHRLAGRLSVPPIQRTGGEAAALQRAARIALRVLEPTADMSARYLIAQQIAKAEGVTLDRALDLVAAIVNPYWTHLEHGGKL